MSLCEVCRMIVVGAGLGAELRQWRLIIRNGHPNYNDAGPRARHRRALLQHPPTGPTIYSSSRLPSSRAGWEDRVLDGVACAAPVSCCSCWCGGSLQPRSRLARATHSRVLCM